ncbi:MAG: hypothetical protein PHN75_06590 [Syntrophales bacterium]|nr:hypothetical protein [Syntrophales bacterium]
MKSANNIKIIFYSSMKDETGGRLQRVIEMLFTREQIEIYRTIDMLAGRLHQPLTEPSIFVILTSSTQELNEMLGLKETLSDRRIILVLPDSEPDTISRGHSLRPRFLTYTDSDFLEVLAVLGKMAGAYLNGIHRFSKHLHL